MVADIFSWVFHLFCFFFFSFLGVPKGKGLFGIVLYVVYGLCIISRERISC